MRNPKTVKLIWDYAFLNCRTVEEFIVDAENTAFTAKDGVLFSKNLYTLIQYPYAFDANSYTVPSSTVEIAYGAFGDGGNVFCPKNLETLTIGKNVTVYGAGHFGSGYRDSAPQNNSEVITIDGYFEKLQKIFGTGLIVR